MSRQSQSAGDNSTQVLASGDVIMGVSEERARDIAEKVARRVIDKFAAEGVRVIQDRITKLDDRVIAALIREGRLEVFADPGFQRSYKRAQEGAAVSDADTDYDLLAGLLVDRAARGATRTIRAGIERSIEIVDQIDDEALRGLTVFQAIQQYSPLGPRLNDGLDAMDGLFSDLLDGPLPIGADWLDHLDILDAVRINQVSTLRPFREYYPERMIGYLASGLPAENFQWPFSVGGQLFVLPDLVAEHELKPGYLRFNVAQEGTLRKRGLPDALVEDLAQQARSTMGFDIVDASLVDAFLTRLRERPALAKIETWWSQIPQAVQVTAVGRVLARANALRLDARGVLPAID